VRPFGIHVVLIEPGSIRTSFVEHHHDAETRRDAYAAERTRVLAQMSDADSPWQPSKGGRPRRVARH
jgi:NAD(P)-dependent dehydrogenase (short-subunit alcohol dehydrogenase family)